MGTSLTYWSTLPPSVHVMQEIRADAEGLQRLWWAEGINFFTDPTGAGRAYGDTKLFLIAYTTNAGVEREVPPEDDSAMAYRDASFIVEQLERWSAVHRLEWSLSCAGEVAGGISQGSKNAKLGQFLDSLREIAEFDQPATPKRLESIDADFSDRWE